MKPNREAGAHYLALVGLDEYVNQFPLYLSGGQRQRVGLARALAIESDIVLMDEPFASVDELTARQLRQTTRRLCEQLHRTVLFVTHNLAEAAYMSDYVVTLDAPAGALGRLRDQSATVAAPLGTGDLWLRRRTRNQSDAQRGGRTMKCEFFVLIATASDDARHHNNRSARPARRYSLSTSPPARRASPATSPR